MSINSNKLSLIWLFNPLYMVVRMGLVIFIRIHKTVDNSGITVDK